MSTKDQDAQECHHSQKKPSLSSNVRSRHERKGWITQQALGRWRILKKAGMRYSTIFRKPRRNPSRRINLNKTTSFWKTSDAITETLVSARPGASTPRSTLSHLKRKQGPPGSHEFSPADVNSEVSGENDETPAAKKQKQSISATGITDDAEGKTSETDADRVVVSMMKVEKEKQRQKKKKKRQKNEKQVQTEEHQRLMEERARQAEAESLRSRRFLVAIPLASVGGLSGRSVCSHFRKKDLTLNDIFPVPIETLSASGPAKSLYDSLKAPIYFSVSCKKSIAQLKQRLKSASVCSKLLVVSEERFNEVVIQGTSLGTRLPRLLGKQTLTAIEQVLEDAQPPHELESSQNAEDKIKCLFKPILRSLDLQDTIITTGFSWREKIGLRSSIDLATHDYSPKSDAAVIKLLDDKKAKILILFEAYSMLSQSLKTPDENRADRVRLLIQGSYLSIRDEKPSVVYYLTRERYIETILIFSENERQSKFGYYAEKQPFYDEVTWVDLVCQIVNLV